MSPRTAHVLFRDALAGTIHELPDRSTVFAYSPEQREPIACALPLTPNVHRSEAGLHPFFQHMTAEGWLRGTMARVGDIASEDDLGLLLRFGRDCIGAVSIRPPVPAESDAILAGLDPLEAAAVRADRTVSGVQKKLLVTPSGAGYVPAGPDGAAPFIAKFDSDDIPTLVRNEHLTLDHARRLLGEAEVTGAIRAPVAGFGPALIVTRFDRAADGRKLRLEDLCQVMARARRVDDGHKYDASYEEATAAIMEHSARPEADRVRLFRGIIASVLLGNCDAHLKNFSMLETESGLRLSPFHDILNTVVYARQGYSTRFALRIDGAQRQHDSIDRALLERLAHNIGLPAPLIDDVFARMKRPAAAILAGLRRGAEGEPGEGLLTDYHDVFAAAYGRLYE